MFIKQLSSTHSLFYRSIILTYTTCAVIMATCVLGCSGNSIEEVQETEPVEVRPPKAAK